MAELGRPLKYTPEELTKKTNEYFKMCDEKEKPYTISGLCLYLDTTRETIREYELREEFVDTIKRAKQRVENYVEEYSLIGKLNPTVSIFNLKNNFNWKDKTEIDNNVKVEKTSVSELISSIEELKNEK